MAFLGLGGSRIPGYDTNALNAIAQQNAEKQRQLIQQRFSALQPVNQQFQAQRGQLSASITPAVEQNLAGFRTDIGGVNAAEQAARTASTNAFQNQAFRNVPEIQRAIRNSLSGNRLLNSGAAGTALTRPVVAAAQNASDFTAQNEAARLANVAARGENLATTGFNTRQSATASRLGIDEGTINSLLQMGRGDLVDRFNGLSGVESNLGDTLLSNEQLRQSSDIARAQADAARRNNVISGLTQLGGAGIGGALGGPFGAAIGGQAGGTLGQIATGSPTQFDPTLLFALNQQKRRGIVQALSGGRSYNPNITEGALPGGVYGAA